MSSKENAPFESVIASGRPVFDPSGFARSRWIVRPEGFPTTNDSRPSMANGTPVVTGSDGGVRVRVDADLVGSSTMIRVTGAFTQQLPWTTNNFDASTLNRMASAFTGSVTA